MRAIMFNNKGYIVLISVIIISLLLVALTAAVSYANYFSRLNVLQSEFKARSYSLAEGCVNYAKTRLMNDPINYAGNELAVPVGANTCSVISITPVGSVWPKTIKTKGIYPTGQPDQSVSNLLVVVNSDYSLMSWQEVPN